MPWRATHRYARISEQKARLVIDMIRGQRCDDALAILEFTHNRAASFIDKVLRSAMANANEQEATMNRLVVSEARIDGGPIIKRFHPKDRGRAHPIQKRTSHIHVTVDELLADGTLAGNASPALETAAAGSEETSQD